MHVIIHPVANLPGLPGDAVSVSGDVLTVNGEPLDLAAIPEGGSAEATGEHPFAGPITRTGGVLTVPLVVRYDTTTAEPDQPADPAHWTVTVNDGNLPDRVVRKPEVSA